MTRLLTEADRQAIRDAIQKAESRTSGELITVIAPASDDYLYIPTLWAALVSLAIPGMVLLFNVWIAYAWIYGAQVLAFFILTALFRVPAIKMRLLPKIVKQQRASRVAREQFFQQNLHHTKDRTGVLIFISVAEHYVEIIADKGINDVVPVGTWESIVTTFVGHVQHGEIKSGFITAINACGEVLNTHFPAEVENVNELPNHLIEL